MGNKFDFEHFYVVEKPMYKRAANYDTHYHFKVKQRNGNDIVFSNSDRKDISEYPGKVLTNPKTGDEICFITIDGSQCRLEARNGFSQGRNIPKTTLNSLVKATWDDNKGKFEEIKENMTVGDFLNKKAEEASKNKTHK